MWLIRAREFETDIFSVKLKGILAQTVVLAWSRAEAKAKARELWGGFGWLVVTAAPIPHSRLRSGCGT